MAETLLFDLLLEYTYNQGGNRQTKVEKNPDTEAILKTTVYHYDVEDVSAYRSQDNRLMYEVRVDNTNSNAVLEKRWYTYDERGRVYFASRMITGDVDGSNNQYYRGTRLFYDTREQLWLALSERWILTGGGDPVNCDQSTLIQSAMEYRYDGGRKRYMVRALQPSNLTPATNHDGTWHDYDGDDIYGDYTIGINASTPFAIMTTSHAPGLAEVGWTVSGTHSTVSSSGADYVHGNLIGTTEVMTDATPAAAHRKVFTAFGEPVYESGSVDTRYGYAGAHGYQEPSVSGDPLGDLGWLHVGARYYDPRCGRFMQRDPIGIPGGANAYLYVTNNPLIWIDPDGFVPPNDSTGSVILTPSGPVIVGQPFGPRPPPSSGPWNVGLGKALVKVGIDAQYVGKVGIWCCLPAYVVCPEAGLATAAAATATGLIGKIIEVGGSALVNWRANMK